MRTVAIVGVLLACCTVATGQDTSTKSDTPPTSSDSWWSRLWGPGDKPAAKKKADADKKTPAVSADALAVGRRSREEAALNRRNEIILKLREIALRTDDTGLLRQADELQDRAWAIYLQKTAGLPGAEQAKEQQR